MANQIARNFAIAGEDKAVLATADHIADFWDPLMKQRIFARALAGEPGLSVIAAKAVGYLRENGKPASQTQATQFGDVLHAGASDAG